MQTFLPYADFVKTAKCLDYRRLGKQRVEAFQILNILEGKTTKAGWKHHPAVLMWEGYENALKNISMIFHPNGNLVGINITWECMILILV